MTGNHNLKPLRSHAGAGLRSRLADWFRRDDEPQMLPAPPMVDLQYDDGLDLKEALDALLAQDEPGWDLAATAVMQPHPPWDTAEQQPVTAASWPGYKGETLTDPRQPDVRPYAADRMSPLRATVEDDLGRLLLFREAVRREIVRRERPRTDAEDSWLASYARLWHQRAAATQKAVSAPEPDFGLHRYDGIVGEIVTQARVTADAAYIAERAAAAAIATCAEYAGRHSTGNEAAA
jgi:hypothetical protein